MLPRDQLQVEVAAFGRRPTTAPVEDLTPECEVAVEATAGVLLFQTLDVTSDHERQHRLMHHGEAIVIQGTSFRMKDSTPDE